MDSDAPTTTVEAEIRADLLERNGPLLSGAALCRALGYPTLAAMRQSITRDTFPVPTFLIEGRRGRFALRGGMRAVLSRYAPGLHAPGRDRPDLTVGWVLPRMRWPYRARAAFTRVDAESNAADSLSAPLRSL